MRGPSNFHWFTMTYRIMPHESQALLQKWKCYWSCNFWTLNIVDGLPIIMSLDCREEGRVLWQNIVLFPSFLLLCIGAIFSNAASHISFNYCLWVALKYNSSLWMLKFLRGLRYLLPTRFVSLVQLTHFHLPNAGKLWKPTSDTFGDT